MTPESIPGRLMPRQPDQPATAPTSRRWRVWAIVSVGVFMASLDLFIVNIAFPDIEPTSPARASRTCPGC